MKNKDVLVTGGAGFIGSHLVKQLLLEGANVSVIVKYKSIIDNIRLTSIWKDLKIIEADLRNIDSIRQMKNDSYDYIFHLAAYNHVGDSFLHYSEAMHSNMIATMNFIENCPDYNKFLYVASSEVYGLQEVVPFVESEIPFPISPYAVGKYGGELYMKMKQHQTGKKIMGVRPFNTFGPYQSDRAVIPELIIKCLQGVTIETTEGKQTREFNYVENTVDGLIKIIKHGFPSWETINIGSGQDISIRNLVKRIHSLTESKSELKIGALKTRPTEIWEMSANTNKAEKLINWSPPIKFEDGLMRTIKWFRKYMDIYYNNSSPLYQL
jgi:UDP-glucose 4-epimerase